MEFVFNGQHFTNAQIRALYQAICVDEDTDITSAFAVMALEDGVDIVNDIMKDPEYVSISVDANTVRNQAHMLVECGLKSFVTDINEKITNIPMDVTTKVVVTATARIG